jgi:hypothetical protein
LQNRSLSNAPIPDIDIDLLNKYSQVLPGAENSRPIR